ncbi:Sir2 family NAD-dependent protein deacetylase, partial [Klebsiella pneumoniae]|uniref:Sir2 family NAD-dependent protein deacetylase n=1 Tax=Klebsiella pneumoniae TaxID=573 RepID=UPI0030135D9D
PAWQAEPNAGHLALATLEHGDGVRAGRSVRIITQNIDRLHQKAGSSPRKVVEIHGNMFEVVCVSCTYHTTMEVVLER